MTDHVHDDDGDDEATEVCPHCAAGFAGYLRQLADRIEADNTKFVGAQVRFLFRLKNDLLEFYARDMGDTEAVEAAVEEADEQLSGIEDERPEVLN